MRIASWNVNSLRVRLPQVLDWLARNQPDLLALQETKLVDADFPAAELAAAGYHCLYSGQKTYNGVAILSKLPGTGVLTDLPDLDDPQRRILAAGFGDIRLVNIYVPNGSETGSGKYAYKLDWLSKVTAFLKAEIARYPQLAVLGDFNIAPDDRDVYDPAAWHENILCSTPERQAFQGLLAVGLQDSFRLFEQPAACFSWWDYRAAGFRRNLGLRIDHVLLSEPLALRCTAAGIDKTPRAWERPSDHAPVVAELSG
ncbi:MAG: exodeoxyribonuclease III [Methylococcaceae bacterium]|nr:MAG: exodeoxyribonuclease III [Methylococcaceae bacterium]